MCGCVFVLDGVVLIVLLSVFFSLRHVCFCGLLRLYCCMFIWCDCLLCLLDFIRFAVVYCLNLVVWVFMSGVVVV